MASSPLIAELASLAAEAEQFNAETFTYEGKSYRGVLNTATVGMALAVPGYAESATATLAASLPQFETPPQPADAAARKLVTIRGRAWKVVTIENDGLYIKFGLHLEE